MYDSFAMHRSNLEISDHHRNNIITTTTTSWRGIKVNRTSPTLCNIHVNSLKSSPLSINEDKVGLKFSQNWSLCLSLLHPLETSKEPGQFHRILSVSVRPAISTLSHFKFRTGRKKCELWDLPLSFSSFSRSMAQAFRVTTHLRLTDWKHVVGCPDQSILDEWLALGFWQKGSCLEANNLFNVKSRDRLWLRLLKEK